MGIPAGRMLAMEETKDVQLLRAEVKRLQGVLRHIANNLKTDEVGEDDGGDIEVAYDAIIEDARSALT